MKTAKFISEISVIDPDTNQPINISVYKHENGGIFAIDSSYIEQVLDDDFEDGIVSLDPLSFDEVTKIPNKYKVLLTE